MLESGWWKVEGGLNDIQHSTLYSPKEIGQ
jgi:hypothetical protein